MDIYKRSAGLAGYLVLPLLLLVLVSSSCRSRKARKAAHDKKIAQAAMRFDETEAADELESLFSGKIADDSIWAKGRVYDISKVLYKTYGEEDYFPVWLTANGDTSYVIKLLEDLAALNVDGLRTERYQISEISKLLKKYRTAREVSVEDVIALDTTCTQSYLLASRDLLLGKIVPKQADSLWFHANDSTWQPYIALAKMGKGDGGYPSLDSFRSKIVTYRLLREATIWYEQLKSDSNYLAAKQEVIDGYAADSVKDFVMASEIPWLKGQDAEDIFHSDLLAEYQYYIGAKNYSKKDSLTAAFLQYPVDSLRERAAVNMERIRWMQQRPEQKYVLVNIPLMELFFRIDGGDSMHMEVVVGKTIRQTPSLSANMANVVINPPWGVPPTIMKKDVLPGMAKSGKAYLHKKGLKVYDFKGKSVDASVVTANNYKRYVFRQDPGDDNALGYVKFNLPNRFDIYLHDTPHREDFGKKDRFLSSGCIRVQKPKEMAEFILANMEGKRYTRERIDSVIETKKTRYEVLKNKIPVHIVYLTAFEDSSATRVHFLYDMYKRDNKLKALLK